VRKGATAEINALVKDSMKILNNRMDKLMPEFEEKQPGLLPGVLRCAHHCEQRHGQEGCCCGGLTQTTLLEQAPDWSPGLVRLGSYCWR
jgi:hypothetical protein